MRGKNTESAQKGLTKPWMMLWGVGNARMHREEHGRLEKRQISDKQNPIPTTYKYGICSRLRESRKLVNKTIRTNEREAIILGIEIRA
jgi:hypothetical protein